MPARSATVALLIVAGVLPVAGQQPQVVHATNPPVWGAAPRLVEEVRIGALDGAEEYVFGRVGAVAAAGDGGVYVADTQVPIIRMYDARGTFVRNVGGPGEGPGEYQWIGGMKVLADGRLAVWDNGVGRITVFDPAGDYAAGHPFSTGFYSSDIFQVDRDGRFYVRTILVAPDDFQKRLGGAWIRVGTDGQVVDTLRIPEDEDEAPSFVVGGDRPFSTQLLTAVSPLGYLVTGRNDRYAFELRRQGDPAIRIERPYDPVPVRGPERAEWEAWADYFEERAANPRSSNPNVVLPAPRRIDYEIPAEKPAYSALRADADGRIWVRRYVAAEHLPSDAPRPGDRPPREWRERPTYDVFEPTGRFLGTVALPWNADLHDAVGRHVWLTLRGQFDEAYVARFRIEPGGL